MIQLQNKIDSFLNTIFSNGSNLYWKANSIEPEMLLSKECLIEGYVYWQAINSRVSNNDISELENIIGHKLPKSYVDFLKYKHFYELRFYGCEFIPHPINSWKNELTNAIKEDKDLFLSKGYIVFAYHLPEGVYCFDTNTDSGGNFPIIKWTPDKADEYKIAFDSFETMMRELNGNNLLVIDNN